jgi:hypothetical protein
MKVMVDNDVCLKNLGSAKLRILQISICHCWSMEKQNSKMKFQLEVYTWKPLIMMMDDEAMQACS